MLREEHGRSPLRGPPTRLRSTVVSASASYGECLVFYSLVLIYLIILSLFPVVTASRGREKDARGQAGEGEGKGRSGGERGGRRPTLVTAVSFLCVSRQSAYELSTNGLEPVCRASRAYLTPWAMIGLRTGTNGLNGLNWFENRHKWLAGLSRMG